MNYGEKLKYLRGRKNITQIELSKIINISNKTYNHYELENDTIPLKHLISLCNYFDVSLDYIFDFTEIMHYPDMKKEIDRKKVGSRLKEFRNEHNLTQAKLAKVLNTVHQVINNYENGKRLIATPFLYTICKKYNISADYLLGRIDKNTLKSDKN